MTVDVHRPSTPNALLIDTGANVSVYTDPTLFVELCPPTTTLFVCFGPKSKMNVQGVGCVIFNFTDSGGTTHTVTIFDVLYVPTQPHNIICLRDIFVNGGGINLDHAPYYVRWKVNSVDVYHDISFSDDLPYALITRVQQVNSVRKSVHTSDKTAYTHARFGHIGTAKLQQLHHLGHLNSNDQVSTPTFSCEVCTRANARLDPYPSRQDFRATHPNHTFHTDLIILPKEGSYRYLLLVLDEFTRYIFPAPLATKDKAAEALLCIMKRAQVLHLDKIKFIHNDQGGEFQSTVFRIAKEELGIATEFVPARCHESNGLIERANRTIQEKVRALLIAACLPDSFWSEAALHAVHLYNLTPHSSLPSAEGVCTPHATYMKESPERLQRMYDQLVPFGTLCNVTLTDEHLRKLAPRSVPAVVLGTGPSTTQYRVCLLKEKSVKVHIVRHITISAEQQSEILHRTTGPFGTTRRGNTTFLPTTRDIQVNTVALPHTVPSMHALTVSTACSPEPAALQTPAAGQERLQSAAPPAALCDESATRGVCTTIQPLNTAEAGQGLDCRRKSSPGPLADSPLPPRSKGTAGGHSAGTRPYNAPAPSQTSALSTAGGILSEGPLPCEPRIQPGADNRLRGAVLPNSGCSRDPRRRGRLRRANGRNSLKHEKPDEPPLHVASASPEANEWMPALHEEYESLVAKSVFDLVQRPASIPVIKGKWVLKVKRDENGDIERFKARYVAKGFAQRHHVHYEDVWAPTAHYSTLRLLFAVAVERCYSIRHVDVKCAFLNGCIEEELYVEQPELINDGNPQHVWRLRKALYGLKQAGRQWHLYLTEVMHDLNFRRAGYDPALFVSCSSDFFVLMWVDDLFLIGTPEACSEFTAAALKRFDSRDLGEAHWLLGMAIQRDDAGTMTLSHSQMIENMLTRYGIQPQRTTNVPLEPNQPVGPDPHRHSRKHVEDQLLEVDSELETTKLNDKLRQFDASAQELDEAGKQRYMQIVGSLQYVATVTRPDICFAASSLARYMSCPTAHLLNCAERVLKYLSSTKTHVLTYKKSGTDFNLTGYSDADWAGCEVTRKSTSGILIYLNGSPVYWRSKRQPIVTMSSTEAELVALTELSLQVKWLKNLATHDLNLPLSVTPLLCDNNSTVTLAKDPIASDRTKHIEVRHRKVQELVETKEVEVKWIPTEEQAADILTKPLARPTFMKLKEQLQVQAQVKFKTEEVSSIG
jgi:transposase InsO family protein